MTTETEEKKELCVVDAKLLTEIRNETEAAYWLLQTALGAIKSCKDIEESMEVSMAMIGPLLILHDVSARLYEKVLVAIPEIRENDYEAVEKKEPRRKGTR